MENITSIIILSYNTFEILQMCITSIRGFTKPNTYELIVVDNASKDGSVEWLKKQKDIRCIFNEQNAGFPKGCNQGMAIAEGSEIMLLNSDVIVTPRWLEQLKLALYSDSKIGAVSCVTSSCSNSQQIEVPYDKKNIDIDILIEFAEKYNHTNTGLWTPYFTLVGFCMMFKREVYQKIGKLDERFSPGNYEDDDYSLRIRKAGYRLLLCRDTFIHHFGSSSFIKSATSEEKKEKIRRYNELLCRNEKYFLQKWNLNKNYKKFYVEKYDFVNNISAGSKVLIVGNNNIQDIFMLKCWYGDKIFEYLTNNEIEKQFINEDFKVYYGINLTETVKKIKEHYAAVVIWIKKRDYLHINKILESIDEKCEKKVVYVIE